MPHHQGAINMARRALRHAKDVHRHDAEAIVIPQQQEIYEFRHLLARRAHVGVTVYGHSAG